MLGRSPGGGHGNPPQYSSLGSPVDRGAWRATVVGLWRVERDRAHTPLLVTAVAVHFPEARTLPSLRALGLTEALFSLLATLT